MMNQLMLCPTKEDKERINALLQEIGDIIARSNKCGLEIDFDHWAAVIFGSSTGYGHDVGSIEDAQDTLSPFKDFIEGLDL